ncbi:M14 family zinc carboxypeptidase [Streptomyces sp. NPDC021093]|uniref:M14 family zinc carboxypeptidase n=1 Tax=Streptomyces sp. NPDC021093 TaxID=3365112 RepID=UPI00379FD80C
MGPTRHRIPRPVLVGIAALAGAALLAPAPAAARPGPGGKGDGPHHREGGSAAHELKEEAAAEAPAASAARALDSATPTLRHGQGGYPRRTALTVPAPNPADKSIKLGLAPYHSIAPKLNSLQKLGNRVSVEIAGKSAGGHDLYLVTVTAPESAKQAREQERMRERIENEPASAAKDRRIKETYKTPVFINNNIHGNEWEGTDASLKLIEELARANDARTGKLLAQNRIYINVTANPDGRIAGTRPNANGFDINRDFITATQPEARAIRQIAIDKQPAVMLDMHGYVNGTLIEPTTPPHGENYEYDLFLKNSYANALGMEAAVNGLGYTPAKDGVDPVVIPFRDQQEGWDDWPPVFTPQYMPFQGAVATHTIEIPLQVNNEEYDTQPVAELRRRSAINTDIAGAAIKAALNYTSSHRTSVIADQIETFRRGAAGAEQVPVSEETVPGVPGIGPEDVYTTDFPSAYVIPAGVVPGGRDGQRSAVAAARLVDHLVANDVRVERAVRGFRLGGKSYPAGSYVVDMKQPKRGIANVILAEGRDISADVSAMYDISGWSLGLLWGASVDKVMSGQVDVPGRTVHAASATGYVAPWGDLRLRLDDPKEIAALNSLLGDGVKVRRAADGTAVVPGSARWKAVRLADRYGVAFHATRAKGVAPIGRTRVAAAVSPGELFALREMGFEVTPVSTDVLNEGFAWKGVDTLYVSADLEYGKLKPAAKAGLDGFLKEHGLVGLGGDGAKLNADTALIAARAVQGNGDANGVVKVDNSSASPVTAGAPAHTFVFSPMWFTELGKGVRADQSYGRAGGNPLVSGHWRAGEDGTGGPKDAAGRASVVSGTSAQGTEVVLFGTQPLFRAHPKGEFAQVARALFVTAG